MPRINFAILGLTQNREGKHFAQRTDAGSRAMPRVDFAILGLTQNREVGRLARSSAWFR
jgi:hypothetical protein